MRECQTLFPETTECLIIGGGVVGLSIAYELAGRDVAVTIIDSQQPGREASWAGAGILPPGSWYIRHPLLDDWAQLSRELNRQWAAALRQATGIDNELHTCGGTYLVSSDERLAELTAIFEQWSRRGIEVESIDAGRLRELEPYLGESPQRLASRLGGFHLPQEAQLRNPRHLKALVGGCESRGVRIVAPCAATSLEVDRGNLRRVITDRGRVECDQVVLAAGAWSEPIAGSLGIRLPVRPVRGQVILYEAERPAILRGNVHLDGYYAVPRRDGHILVGATVEEAGFNPSTTPEGIDSLARWGAFLTPRFEDIPVERTWAGLRPASPDGLPYIGRCPRVGNLWIATGHYRSGIQFAAATATVLADLVTGRPTPFDLHPFRLDR